MIIVPNAILGKSPAVKFVWMYAPKPEAKSFISPQLIISAMMLAFHAPPAAVIAPVTKYGAIPGKIMRRHQRNPFTLKLAAASFNSFGRALVPAITLNRIYH